MKKLFIILLFLGLLTVFCYAEITVEQLNKAEYILTQMSQKITTLRGYVQTAQSGKLGFLTLTTEQIQQLKDQYVAEKQELVKLYKQLP